MKRRHFIEKLLMSPKTILGICLIWIILHLIVDGTAVKIWRLSQRKADLTKNIVLLKQKTQNTSLQIQKSYMPDHLERLAKEKFDMLKDDDVLFIFPYEAMKQPQK